MGERTFCAPTEFKRKRVLGVQPVWVSMLRSDRKTKKEGRNDKIPEKNRELQEFIP